VETELKIQKKLMVCATCKCNKCHVFSNKVPEDCEYAIKHILDTREEGVVIKRPRRSGKTTDILKMAIKVIDAGLDAIVIVPNSMEARRLQRMCMGTGVRFLVARNRQDISFFGLDRSRTVMFSDSVEEGWIVDAVEEQGFRFIIGYK
jgi:hypothetical protein